MKSAAFMTHTLEYFYGHLLYIKELEKKSAYLWKSKSKPKHNKISKISFQILIDNWHFSFRFTFHTLTDNLLTNISISYFIGGDAASKAKHTSAHVRDHCRPPVHLLYWSLPARRGDRPDQRACWWPFMGASISPIKASCWDLLWPSSQTAS